MENSSKEIQKIEPVDLAIRDDGEYSAYLDKNKFDHIWRVGVLFSKSDLVPVQYKGKPENCVLAFNMATRLHIDPIMLMQKTYIVHGRPGMEGQLVIALVNARGPFKGPIQWKFEGEGRDRSCTAYAVHRDTGQTCSATVTWKMVELEGWSKKEGSKWLTMPDQMFRYRSATFLARLYCPEVILGFQTIDEIEDTEGRQFDQKSSQPVVSSLEERLVKPVQSVQVKTLTETPTTIPPAENNEQEQKAEGTAKKRRVRKESIPDTQEYQPDEIEIQQVEKKETDTLQVPENERYYCNECGNIFGTPAGVKKNLCRICLSADIVDRFNK